MAIRLTWTNHGGTGSNQIYRKKDAGDYILIDTVAFNVSTYDDNSLTLNGDYTYKVINANGGSLSTASNTVTVTGLGSGSGTPPSSCTSSWNSSINRATVSWTNGTGTGDNIIERQKGSGSFIEVGTVAYNVATFNDDTITENDTYTYRVRNSLVTGYATASGLSVSTFGGSGEVGTPPTSAYVFLFDAVRRRITIKWTNHGGTGSNLVEVDVDSGGFNLEATLASSQNSVLIYLDVEGFYTFKITNLSCPSGYAECSETIEFI